MTVFHFAFIFILLSAVFSVGQRVKRSKRFCIVSGVIYFLIAAMRGFGVGNDTGNYYHAFLQMANYPLKAVFKSLVAREEYLFYLFLWIIRQITANFTVVLAIIALLFTVAAWLYIYKYSEDPRLSVIFLLSFNIYQFTLTGLRQTMAISFVLLAIMALKKEKVFVAVLLILVASLFHASALVLLPIVFLRRIKLSRETLFCSLVILLIVFVARVPIAAKLIPFIADRGYIINVSSSGFTMAFVVFALYTFFVVFSREYEDYFGDYRLVSWMMLLACFFEMLVPAQNIFFRIAFYFLIIGIELIPNMVMAVHHDRSRKIVMGTLYVLLSIQYLFFTINSSGIMPYYTFWQL